MGDEKKAYETIDDGYKKGKSIKLIKKFKKQGFEVEIYNIKK